MGMFFPGVASAVAPSSIQIDGKLNEDKWKSAPVESGFKPLASRAKAGKSSPAKTSFRWFADKDALYLGIECEEPNMNELKAVLGEQFPKDVFQTDAIEVFFDPKGKGTEYYHFAVNVAGGRYQAYRIESGNTTGGEYGGIWEAAVSRGESGWIAEIRIPYMALYHTSAPEFAPKWKFNIARTQDPKGTRGGAALTSWSPLKKGFHEPSSFQTLSGMPSKDPALDVFVEGGEVEISSKEGNQYPAQAILRIQNNGQSLENAKVEIAVNDVPLESRVISLPKGKTILKMDKIFLEKTGAGKIAVAISDHEGSLLHQRWVTFRADYEQVSVNFSEPFYAQCIFPGQDIAEAKATVQVRLSPEELTNAKLEVAEVASGSAAEGAWKKEFMLSPDGKAEISISNEAVREGETIYRLRVVKGGKVLAEGQTFLRRLPWPEQGKMVYIDRALNLVINGEPTFMLGFMGTGFPFYGSSLAQQRQYGRKLSSRFVTPEANEGWVYVQPDRVLPTDSADFTKDGEPSEAMYAGILERIEKSKKNASSLFYYLNDEPECRGVSPVYLGYLYRFIKKHDPYHPVLIVTRAPERYVGCADILAPHFYTDPNILPDGSRTMRPVSNIVNQVQAVREAGHGKIVPWFTPQAFSYGFLNTDSVAPNFDEFRCMAYAAVIAGAKGLIPFMYAQVLGTTDLRLGYDFIYESLFILEPYLLKPFPGLPVKVDAEGGAVEALLQKHEGNFALLTVNILPTSAKASLELPKETHSKTWYGFRTDETLQASNGRLELEFAPYEVKIFTTDATISPTLKSEATFRRELEAARQALEVPGNLLFGKGREIAWSTSSIWPNESAIRTLFKLCDGETTARGYRAGMPGEDEWIMMGFPKEPIHFRKVRLHGAEVSKVKLSYLKRGKWVEAGEVEWTPEDSSAEIVLPEAVSTVKLRLDLVPRSERERLELYEIELFQ